MNKSYRKAVTATAILAPAAAWAQDTLDTVATAAAEVVTATEPLPVGDPLVGTFGSVAGLAAAVLPVTGWLKTHVLKTANTQALSWAVAAALAGLGYALDLGVFATAGPAWTAIFAVAAGLVANGLANVNVVKVALVLLRAKVKKGA
jgi:hypothetical protein